MVIPAVTGLDDHHQSHRMPAPTVRASEARTVRAQESRARVLFTIDPLLAKSGSRLDRRPGGLLRDPWLCVPASRRVCPERSWCGGRMSVVCAMWPKRPRMGIPRKYRYPGAVGRSCRCAPVPVQAPTGGDAATVVDGRSQARMAETITTTTPMPIRTSPMLKTLAKGTHGGRAKMSVNGASAGSATMALLE